jgi:hypothetical protein
LWQEAAVPGLILAGVNPDNTPSGYYWTFLFPMLLFIVIAVILYMLFSRPHRRVPGRPITSAVGDMPSAEIAQAASVVGGLSIAPGGDTDASVHEPEGAVLVAEHDGPDTGSADAAGAESDGQDDAAQTGQAEHAEGSE